MISCAYWSSRSAEHQPQGKNKSHDGPKTPQTEQHNGPSIQKKSSEEDNGVSANNSARQAVDELGGKQSPAAHEHDGNSSTPTPIVKNTSDNDKSNNFVSNFFKDISIKYAWAGAYTGSNILRIGEGVLGEVLNEVGQSDPELAGGIAIASAVINVARMAMVVILQIYDTASAEHSGNELVKKEGDSKVLIKKLKKSADAAIALVEERNGKSASARHPEEKENSTTSSKKDDSAKSDSKDRETNKFVEDYCVVSKAKNNVAKYSASVGEAKGLSGLVSAKETFFTAGAVVGLVKGVLVLAKLAVSTVIAGTAAAAGVAIASLVLAVTSVVASMAANVIDIYQGFAKRREAREEIKDFSNRKSVFHEKISAAGSLNPLSPMFKSGLSSFFDKKVASANIDEGYAVGRIIRGFVGLAISVANAVCLVISGGSTSVITSIVGGVTLAVYFGFMIAKIKREALKVAAEIEECNAAEDLKNQYADKGIFDETVDTESGTENDRFGNPYDNQYFLVWMVAKQFKNDVLKHRDTQKVQRMDDLLKTIGLLEQDIEVLKLLPADSPNAIELIEGMIRSKLKITDRKPQQKEPAQASKTATQGSDAPIPRGFQPA